MNAYETATACALEVEDLHEFFVGWFTGTIANDPEAWSRAEHAMAPGFVLIPPGGQRLERSALLEGIRGMHASRKPGAFEIWTKNFELVHAGPDLIAARYEEWQRRDGETLGRVSSAVFVPHAPAPHGVAWLSVHETWLPEAAPSGA